MMLLELDRSTAFVAAAFETSPRADH